MALGIRWSKYWSFSFSKSPSNEYSGLFPLGLSDLISLLSKGLSRIFTSTTVQNLGAFFMVQLSHLYMSTGKTIALTIWTFVDKVMSLLFNCLGYIITFLPRNEHLFISWLQPSSTVNEYASIQIGGVDMGNSKQQHKAIVLCWPETNRLPDISPAKIGLFRISMGAY